MNKPKFDPEALKALKTKKNLSAQALSDLSGVPLSTVNRIVRGEGEPNINAVAALAHALGGSLDELCGFSKRDGSNSADAYELLIDHQQEIIAEKRWWIKILAGCLGLIVLFVLAIAAFDVLNGDIGWARYAAYFNGEANGLSEVLENIADIFKT